ncbi:unnamed protein product, partial [Phaeothamnion confervicola]
DGVGLRRRHRGERSGAAEAPAAATSLLAQGNSVAKNATAAEEQDGAATAKAAETEAEAAATGGKCYDIAPVIQVTPSVRSMKAAASVPRFDLRSPHFRSGYDTAGSSPISLSASTLQWGSGGGDSGGGIRDGRGGIDSDGGGGGGGRRGSGGSGSRRGSQC